MKILILISVILTGVFLNTHAQNAQWIVYDTSNSSLPYNGVSSIAIEENGVMWIGAMKTFVLEYAGGSSLVVFNGSDWTIYDTTNSELPSGIIRSIVIDGNSTKWIGINPQYGFDEMGGLAAFDGSNWTVYDTSNSELPSNKVRALASEENNTIWIGTNNGLALFDGTNWVVYDSSNSDLPSNDVLCIAIDGNGIKWIGTDNGLVSFDGTNWTIYNTSNSNLPSNWINCLAIDQNETKWMAGEDTLVAFNGSIWTSYSPPVPLNWIHMVGTEETEDNGRIWISGSVSPLPPGGTGLTSFDGIDWITYTPYNSGLPDKYVFALATDQNGTKWIGTRGGGLAAFNENGIPFGFEELVTNSRQSLVTIYPNPATNTISLVPQPHLEIESMEILNIQGKRMLYHESKNNNFTVNVSGFSHGIYFIRINTTKVVETQKLIIQ